MFTGIVTDVGNVRSVDQRGDLRLVIGTNYDTAALDFGASISCAGTCLTVVDKGDDWFAVDVSAETISKTSADRWRLGARLNLERALRLGDELGGHIVTGHVDAVAEVLTTARVGDSLNALIKVPRGLAGMIATKGSVTIDGVSLTVNEVHDGVDDLQFTVNVIPHTAQRTTLGELAQGQHLNVEIDVLARYLERMLAARAP